MTHVHDNTHAQPHSPGHDGHGHDGDLLPKGPALHEASLRGLSRRELIKRGSMVTGGLLLAGGSSAFAPAPSGALRGPIGASGASRLSTLSGGVGTRLVHADMHNHSLLSDGAGNPANAYGLMRERGLDVAALTEHASGDVNPGDSSSCGEGTCGRALSLTDAGWEYVRELADAANDPAQGFIAIRGFEWTSVVQGHVNVWFSSEYTDPGRTGGQAGPEAVATFLADGSGGDPISGAGMAAMQDSPGAGMAGFYQWLQTEPQTPGWGGGLDGIGGFNHPGREPGRFGNFGHLAGVHDRIVSMEIMNRAADYLFEGVAYGARSPLQVCLDNGWRVGLLGVTDEHGDDAWGGDVSATGKGRSGLWVREDLPYNRVAIKEAMTARRFFATNKSGLRLDLTATSMVTTESVRMGQTLAHQQGAVAFELDIDGINDGSWAGSKPLTLQLLRPDAGLLPAIAHQQEFIVPAAGAGPLRFVVPLDVADGDWAVVRVLDPAEPMPGGDAAGAAGSAFAGLGRAIAYASPIYLDPAADASAEAMQREVIAGVR
jgi:hypothetical protein